jgi:hypothetical protein
MLLHDSMMASFRLDIDLMAICINDVFDPVDPITELRQLLTQDAVYLGNHDTTGTFNHSLTTTLVQSKT